MLRTLFYFIYRLICPAKFPVHTITYYVPAPPKRTTGYREMAFDSYIFDILKKDYKLLSMHVTPHHQDSASGMWVIAVVQSTIPRDALTFEQEQDEIEGLYYIED